MIKNLVSIVVPVYNVQQFLPDCFSSLKKQTYKNIEIIFVNDGSTDNSQKLLEDFCKKHHNAKLINQTNKGVSAARNVGLTAVKGEFLYWLDPDDMIHPQLIETFVNLINKENADFVCGYVKRCSESTTYESLNWNKLENVSFNVIDEQNLINFISGVNIGSNYSLQVKLYRMSTVKLIPEFPQIIPHNYSRGEDLRFNSSFINYCHKAVVVNHIVHRWRQRHTSLTHTSKFNVNDLNVLNALDPYLNFKQRTAAEKKAVLGNKAYQASMLLCRMKTCKYYNLHDVENAYRIFKENRKYCMSKKHHGINIIITPLHIFYWIGFVWKTRKVNKH